MLYAIVGLLAVILDQAVKYWVSMNIFPESTGRVLIPGILSLANLHNDGAAFGFLAGSNARIPFIIITGVFLVLVILALATKFISGRFARWCLVLVAAGGFSNCIDRVIYGYVQDMFKIELFNFPIFNVADIFITVFAILFILAVLFERQTVYDDDELDDEEEEDEYADDEEEEDEEPEPVKPQRKTRKERAAEEYARKKAAEEEERAAKESAAEEARERKQATEEEARARKKAAAAERSAAASSKGKAAPAKNAQEEDIFAAWEQANARANARTAEQRPAKAAPQEAPAKAAPAKSASAPAKAPAKAAAAKKPVVDEDFSLDDILAEFK